MPEKDGNAGELDEAQIILRMIFIANDQAAKVVQPGEKPFNLPTALEAAQSTTVLSDSIRPTALTVWGDHLGAELMEYFFIKRVTVVGLISNQPLWHIRNKPLLQRLVNQLYFSRASTVCAYGDRKTIAVCNCHDLGALAAFSFSHAEPPFFAGAKLPSMNHSL